MSAHASEPWYVGERVELRGGCAEPDENGCYKEISARGWSAFATAVVRLEEDDFDDVVGTANLNRIVACVNACAGMGDPETEIAQLRALEKERRSVVASRNDAIEKREVVAGVALRDYFAGQAMPHFYGTGSPESRARAAYREADAMLAARIPAEPA